MNTIDSINSIINKDAIFFVAEGIKKSWKIQSNHRSPRYATQAERNSYRKLLNYRILKVVI